MKTKPITPYARLLRKFMRYKSQTQLGHRVFFYRSLSVEELRKPLVLGDLVARVETADKLGYDTRLTVSEGKLVFGHYKRPEEPECW